MESPKAGEEGAEPTIDVERRRSSMLSGRRLIAVIVGAVLILAALSTVIILTQQSKETIKIGVIIGGDPSTFSHTAEVEFALEMVVDSINKWGGIGRTAIELVIEETPVDEASALAAFMRIEQNHRPLFYVTVGCELISVLGPLAEENEVPLIGLGSAPGLTEGFEWVFRFYTSAVGEAAAAIHILDDLKVSSLGILHAVDPHGCGINEALLEEFSATGGAVESEGFEDVADLSEKVSNLSDNQAIFCVGSCGALVSMLAEVKDSGYDGYVLTASCGSIPQMWDLPQTQGVYVSAPLIYREENLFAQDFVELFQITYDIIPTHHGAFAYDTVRLVHGLMEYDELSRENLREQLDAGFIYTGVAGIIRVNPGDHDFDLAVFPAVISEGGLQYL